MIIKDNLDKEGHFFFDEADSNLLRPESVYRDIFRAAGLRMVGSFEQETWPAELMPIRCWVLKKASD